MQESITMQFAQAAPSSGGGLMSTLLMFGAMFAILYFILIRPQQKRQRELQETISTLKNGDKVITSGGIVGVITNVRDNSFFIRTAEKTILEVRRSSIAGLDQDETK